MIPTKHYLPLSLLIVGIVSAFVAGTTADRYLAIEILGAGLLVMMYFDDTLD